MMPSLHMHRGVLYTAIPSSASGNVSFELWSIDIDQDEIQYVCMYVQQIYNDQYSNIIMSFIMFANVAWCDVAKQRDAVPGQNPFCGG